MGLNHRIWLRHATPDGCISWLGFERPLRTIVASDVTAVLPALEQVDSFVRHGAWVAGFVSYEAAPGLDPALTVKPAGELPLVWFGVFDAPAVAQGDLPPWLTGVGVHPSGMQWVPTMDEASFGRALGVVRRYLMSGDTYQVNFTFRMVTDAPADEEALFAAMLRNQTTPYAAFVDAGRHVLLSVSPELFFIQDGDRVTCRPMKGTARRGLWHAADVQEADALAKSPKNQAENVMIVDMIRNDLGRVADRGTVNVESLFDVERYETVLQMTSTVTARTTVPFSGLMRALFPCASVTGAPKRRTMEIIAELEMGPRGIYTGAIGFIGPGRKAQFSVAIRTVHVDRQTGKAEYGTGAGIVWDSVPSSEYTECLDKARVLFEEPRTFRLLETMLWTPARGVRLLDGHMDRLLTSAAYFGFRVDRRAVAMRLAAVTGGLPAVPHRIRLLVDRSGNVEFESSRLGKRDRSVRTVALAAEPVDASDRFLFHKTTVRGVYDAARRSAVASDDVLLWNKAGEVTETTIANAIFLRGGGWVTPPVRCGLLAGTMRARLLARGCISEAVVRKESLQSGEVFYLANSVRGLTKAVIQRP